MDQKQCFEYYINARGWEVDRALLVQFIAEINTQHEVTDNFLKWGIYKLIEKMKDHKSATIYPQSHVCQETLQLAQRILADRILKTATPNKSYHGFTCPMCGSHMFGTFKLPSLKSFSSRYSDQYAPGTSVGICHAHGHTGNHCDFHWDRSNKEHETIAIYEMPYEEYMNGFILTKTNETNGSV